jgi:hypothetical protein
MKRTLASLFSLALALPVLAQAPAGPAKEQPPAPGTPKPFALLNVNAGEDRATIAGEVLSEFAPEMVRLVASLRTLRLPAAGIVRHFGPRPPGSPERAVTPAAARPTRPPVWFPARDS